MGQGVIAATHTWSTFCSIAWTANPRISSFCSVQVVPGTSSCLTVSRARTKIRCHSWHFDFSAEYALGSSFGYGLRMTGLPLRSVSSDQID